MKSIQQITLRLPDDLARRLAASTPSRKRNQFVVDLVRRELDRESRELEEAARRLSLLEAAHVNEDTDWLSFDDAEASGGEFDENRFLKELSSLSSRSPGRPKNDCTPSGGQAEPGLGAPTPKGSRSAAA